MRDNLDVSQSYSAIAPVSCTVISPSCTVGNMADKGLRAGFEGAMRSLNGKDTQSSQLA